MHSSISSIVLAFLVLVLVKKVSSTKVVLNVLVWIYFKSHFFFFLLGNQRRQSEFKTGKFREQIRSDKRRPAVRATTQVFNIF